MDLLYAISAGSQSLRWGTAPGNLANTLPLGFACHWMAALPGNRVLYATGNKGVSGTRHAWLAVVDTCDNPVVAEIDMGLGFAGQAAVPIASGGLSAYVAISRAFGTTDTGAAGGNRIAILNVTDPLAPTLRQQNFPIPGLAVRHRASGALRPARSALHDASRRRQCVPGRSSDRDGDAAGKPRRAADRAGPVAGWPPAVRRAPNHRRSGRDRAAAVQPASALRAQQCRHQLDHVHRCGNAGPRAGHRHAAFPDRIRPTAS